jgi:predicted GNAT family acetyltransferase
MISELREHADAERFIHSFRPIWEPREPELNLMLGIACRIRDGWRPDRGALLATLEREGRAVAAVLRTPPHGFAVADNAPHAATDLARAIAASGRHHDARGVIATRSCADEFARAWADATGRTAQLEMAQRILTLSCVATPPAPGGRFRRAIGSDAAVIGPWLYAFMHEAMPHEASDRDATIELAKSRIEHGAFYVWETDAGTASMAQLVRATPHTITLTSVYTPPPLRGRGYASACVAAASQVALDSGKRWACLYSDASNPTSNAMYERVGYREICESQQWRFE